MFQKLRPTLAERERKARMHKKGKILIVVNMQEGVMQEANKKYQDNVKKLIDSGKFDKIVYVVFDSEQEPPLVTIAGVKKMPLKEQQALSVPVVDNSEVIKQNGKMGISEYNVSKIKFDSDTSNVYVCGTDVGASVYTLALNLRNQYVNPVLITDAFMSSSEIDAESSRNWELAMYEEELGDKAITKMEDLKFLQESEMSD